jgi:hypothetical protein
MNLICRKGSAMRLPSFLLFCAMFATAAISSVAGDVTALSAALAGRLGLSPPPTEAAWLSKAWSALAKYGGTEGRADLRRAASALVATDRSGTADTAVNDASDALVTAFADLAATRKTEAESVIAGLKVARDVDRAQKAADRADALVAAADFASGRGLRAGFLAKAVGAFDKAKALATKLTIAEIRKGVSDPGTNDGAEGTFAMLVGTTLWTADEITAVHDAGNGTLFVRGTQHGSPDLTLELTISGIAGPGTNLTPPFVGMYIVWVNGLAIDFFHTQTGSLTLNAIDPAAGTASGSFNFTALSPYTGTMTVPSGQFSITGID